MDSKASFFYAEFQCSVCNTEFYHLQLAHPAQVNYGWILVLTWNNNAGNRLRTKCVALALSAYGHFSCTNSRIHMSVFDKLFKNLVEYLRYIADTPWYGKLLHIDVYDVQKPNFLLSSKLIFAKPEQLIRECKRHG
jgi:hypothetical protein